jgi:hypothetical protein
MELQKALERKASVTPLIGQAVTKRLPKSLSVGYRPGALKPSVMRWRRSGCPFLRHYQMTQILLDSDATFSYFFYTKEIR